MSIETYTIVDSETGWECKIEVDTELRNEYNRFECTAEMHARDSLLYFYCSDEKNYYYICQLL